MFLWVRLSLRCVYPYSTTSHGVYVALLWRFLWAVRCCIPVSVIHFLLYLGFYPKWVICFVSMKGKNLVLRNVFYLCEGPLFPGAFHLLLFQVTFITIIKNGRVFSSLSLTHSSVTPSSPARHMHPRCFVFNLNCWQLTCNYSRNFKPL